jgi:FtsH-binding integral membrane protein
LVYLLSIPASNTISKHIALIIWLLLFGSITFPITERALSLDKDVLNQIITIFIVIVVSASGIVFLKPDMISRSWGFPLMVGLLSLILSQIVFVLFGFNQEANNMISFFSVILFTLFISYDTKTAYLASKNCIEGTANYINYALSLFLDFINLFSSLER